MYVITNGTNTISCLLKTIFFAFGCAALSIARRTHDALEHKESVISRMQNLNYNHNYNSRPSSQGFTSRHRIVNNSPETNELNILRQYWTNDRTKTSSNEKDCIARGTVHSFPGECYHRYYDTGEKTQDIWWTFWEDVVHDVAYTFDFVLAPVNDYKDAPNFYFLVMFLKSLVTFIDNPLDVIGHKTFQRHVIEVNNQMLDLIRNYEHYESNVNDVRIMCNALTVDMQKFQEVKVALHTKLSGLKINLAQYDIDNSAVEDKLNNIHIQTNSLQGIIESLGNTMLTKFYPVNDGTFVFPGLLGPQQKKQQVKSITFPTNIVANIAGPEIEAR